MKALETLGQLTSCLSKLPGIGRRSAERMALKLVRDKDGLLMELSGLLQEIDGKICLCSECGNIAHVDEDPCSFCTDTTRDNSVLCVVEDPSDMMLIERSGGYRGRYHSLGGRISPMRGEGPEDLRLRALVKRVRAGEFKEIVLALNTDVESDATASFICDLFGDSELRITRLASGLPAGSGVAYSDPVTLARAVAGRQTV